MATDWTGKNVYYLSLMTVGYIVGEIAHFLINTSSKAVATDIKFGDKSCYANTTAKGDDDVCVKVKDEFNCTQNTGCEWNYSGTGIEYQILAGPAFIAVFTISSIASGITSDRIAGYKKYIGRQTLMAAGVLLFSASLFLMGFANAYWQLVVLRMGIAAGEAVCRPTSGSLLAEYFSPSGRGLANGIFSWGVYYGYGLAFVIGIYLTAADVLGYGWRSAYVISSIPGFVIAVLLAMTVVDPKSSRSYSPAAQESSPLLSDDNENDQDTTTSSEMQEDLGQPEDESDEPLVTDNKTYFRTVAKSFCSAPMLLLLLAACFRHTAGYCWAYNTRLYFQSYHPDFDGALGWWLFGCSVGGGSFGVFFGGFFSDRIVDKLGLHSRLWVLSAFTLISTPFAILVLYLDPPYALVMLILYYFCAETWFAILFTVIVEVVSADVRSICIGVFLFVMNNIGGNLPVIVDPISKAIGYREAIYLVWPGGVAISSVLFFVASIPLWKRRNA